MASPEDIRAIREMQRQYGDTGESLSYAEAKKMVQNPPPESKQQRDFDLLNLAVAQTQAKLDQLKNAVERMRVTGPGFSGQGPTGILFQPPEATAGAAATRATVIVRWCVAGAAVDYYIEADPV